MSLWLQLLCVSYPSATKFSAIFFLLFARSSSNSPRSFQHFRRTLMQNFNWIRQQMFNFLINPHCKIRRLSATLWRCQKRTIFTMGFYGEILYPLSDFSSFSKPGLWMDKQTSRWSGACLTRLWTFCHICRNTLISLYAQLKKTTMYEYAMIVIIWKKMIWETLVVPS